MASFVPPADDLDELYDASYGGVRLWCSRVSTTNGRSIVVHDLTTGDDHPTQDKGLEARIARASLLFDDMDGETTSPKQRFDAFCALVEGGKPQIFSHPLRGSYRATVRQFDHELGKGGVISAEVEFVPVDPVPAVRSVATALSASVGVDAVDAAADQADAALAAAGLSSSAPANARAAANGWDSPDVTARQVLVDVGDISEQIGRTINDLELSSNLAYWPAYRALLLLGDTFVSAGRAATADVARLMTVRIGRPIALSALLAGIYGGWDVPQRRVQALALNDIRTPGWIPTGTELRLPQPSAQPRRG